MQHRHIARRTAIAAFAFAGALLGANGAFAQSHDHGAHDHGAMAADAPASAEQAQVEWVGGEIRRIEPAQGRLTVKHGDIRHLDMPGMTMVFKLKPGVLTAERLAQLKVGDRIEFQAEMEKGQLTLTALRAPKTEAPKADAAKTN